MSGHTQEIIRRDKIIQWVLQIGDTATRQDALKELSKRQDVVPDLGLILWESFGTIPALLQEIVNIYSSLISLTLTIDQSQRACYALSLLQSVACHPETKTAFIQAQIPLYICPLLKIYKGCPYRDVRMASLNVLEALVKNDEKEAVGFFLSTNLILFIIEIMEKDVIHLKTIAAFILQKVLSEESGLVYVCDRYDRFSEVTTALHNVVKGLAKDIREGLDTCSLVGALLTRILTCYLRLSENARAREVLRRCLPHQLTDGTFAAVLDEESSTHQPVIQLLDNLGVGHFSFDR